MLSTSTLWFDAAIVLGIFAVGSILFGHFEEHKPRSRRLLKLVLVLCVVLSVSATLGRIWSYSLLAIPLLGAAYIHLRWLPAHGVNGWTGEPKERYLELVAKKRGTRDPERPA